MLSHFSCVQLCVTLWTVARQASLSFTISQSLLKLMFIELVMASNHLIPPASPCPQSFPASGPFLVSWLFTSGSQSIGASASVFSMNIKESDMTEQIHFPLKKSWPSQYALHRPTRNSFLLTQPILTSEVFPLEVFLSLAQVPQLKVQSLVGNHPRVFTDHQLCLFPSRNRHEDQTYKVNGNNLAT